MKTLKGQLAQRVNGVIQGTRAVATGHWARIQPMGRAIAGQRAVVSGQLESLRFAPGKYKGGLKNWRLGLAASPANKKGFKVSDAFREMCRRRETGKKQSASTRIARSEALKGKPWSEARRAAYEARKQCT